MRKDEEVLADVWAERVRAAQPDDGPVPQLQELPDNEVDQAEAPLPAPPPTLTPMENPLGVDPSREQKRSRRRLGVVRPSTTSMRRLPKGQLHALAEEHPERPGVEYERPQRREDCIGGERPCPFVSCRHHLYLNVSKTGGIQLAFPDLEVWELSETCALDAAERGGELGSGKGAGRTLEEVGDILNVTRERIRQIEVRALTRVAKIDKRRGHPLADCAGVNDPGAKMVKGRTLEEEDDGVDVVDAEEDEGDE